jgi:hypothetical protein
VTVTQAFVGGGGSGTCFTVPSSTQGINSFTQLTAQQNVNHFGGGVISTNPALFSSVFRTAWPGFYNDIADFSLPVSSYLGMAFTVPHGYMANSANAAYWDNGVVEALYGNISVASSGYSAPVSMTISTACGDFSNPSANGSTVVAGCYLNKGIQAYSVQWRQSGSCTLQDDHSYFLNVIVADISAVTPNGGGTAASKKTANCSQTACSVPVENGVGSWAAYTPPAQ